MRHVPREDAPLLGRGDGVLSHLLHGRRTDADTDLTVTWVEVEPGAAQEPHAHEPEQVYVIVAGEGRATVDGEARPVVAGDLVHIPSGAEHAIANTGTDPLEYVSAATPALDPEAVDGFYRRDG